CRRRRAGAPARERVGVGGHDPEAGVVRVGPSQRRAPCPHPRRPASARAVARVLHAGGRRHDGVQRSERVRGRRAVMSTVDELRQLDADNVMQTYGRLPVAFVRGEGTRLWDTEGNEYLDFLTGLAVTSLGHAHPEVASAIADQAQTLLHVSNLY